MFKEESEISNTLSASTSQLIDVCLPDENLITSYNISLPTIISDYEFLDRSKSDKAAEDNINTNIIPKSRFMCFHCNFVFFKQKGCDGTILVH